MNHCPKYIIKLFLCISVLLSYNQHLIASSLESGTPPPPFVPCFMNLKSDNVNVRAGPQPDHSVKFTLHRKNLPVKVLAHYQDHRKIQDFTADEGWVHKRVLNKNRYILTLSPTNLHQNEDLKSKIIGKIPIQTIGKLVKCGKTTCLIKFDKPLKKEGWIETKDLWGILDEDLDKNMNGSGTFLKKITSHIGKIFKKQEPQIFISPMKPLIHA